MSLSGGGTRAIGFHLGTLDYLSRADLLEQVKILSTVSGGSLIGTSYALSLAEKIEFQDLFYDLFEFLPSANIVEGLLEIFNRPDKPVASGHRDMATGLAELYHEQFFSQYFSQPTFGAITVAQDERSHHLEEVAFSATEFKTGVAFRFQKSLVDCKVGNGNVWLDPDDANELRVADIVTASSCIPGGFEPIEMPLDFHWPKNYHWGSKKGKSFGPVRLHASVENPVHDCVALMDGGCYDNQGLTTVLLAVSRRLAATGQTSLMDTDAPIEAGSHEDHENNDPQSWARWSQDLLARYAVVDLFIISDTPLRKQTFYPDQPVTPNKKTRLGQWLQARKLNDLNRLAIATALILVISTAISTIRIIQAGEIQHLREMLTMGWVGYLRISIEFLSMLVPLLVAGMIGGALFALRSRLAHATAAMERTMPKLPKPMWHYLKNLSIGDLWYMIRVRSGSLLALAGDIFTNRIRQLSYNLAYSDENLSRTLMANEIYTVDQLAHRSSGLPDHCIQANAEVLAISEIAAHMRTKSWFDPITAERLKTETSQEISRQEAEDMLKRGDGSTRTDLDVLVACGQLTMCFNLICFLQNNKTSEDADPADQARYQPLLDQACQDWNRLQSHPFEIIDKRLNQGRSKEHENQILQNQKGAA